MIRINDEHQLSDILHVSYVHAFLVHLRRELARKRVPIEKKLNYRLLIVETSELAGD
jgi:hypothetical protein